MACRCQAWVGFVRNVDNLTKNVDADGIMGEDGRSTKYGVCMEPVREFWGFRGWKNVRGVHHRCSYCL